MIDASSRKEWSVLEFPAILIEEDAEDTAQLRSSQTGVAT
jgi:hypothetical protein